MDQTALYENGFSEAIQPLSGLLKNNGNKIIIPLRSVEAIQNQMISTNREEITMAQRAMKILMDMQMQDLVEIRGEKSDSNVISTFVSVFAKLKCVNRLALITCDRKLAKQIEALNNDEMGGFHILVLKYENGKGFRKWQEEDFQDKESIEKIYIALCAIVISSLFVLIIRFCIASTDLKGIIILFPLFFNNPDNGCIASEKPFSYKAVLSKNTR